MLDVGCWLLAVGCWLLAVGITILVAGIWIFFNIVVSLTFTIVLLAAKY